MRPGSRHSGSTQPRHSAPRFSISAALVFVTARGEHNVAQQLPCAMRVSVQSASLAQGASSEPPFRWSDGWPASGAASAPPPRERIHSWCAFSAASAAVMGWAALGAVAAGAGGAAAEAVAGGAGRSLAPVWVVADAQASESPSAVAAQADVTP